MLSILDFFEINGMRFQKRPIAISADYRPMFKISQVALVLFLCCRERKASLLKLHLFSWALKSPENMEVIFKVLQKSRADMAHTWGLEPSLNRALKFGIAENIFEIEKESYALSNKGEVLVKKILKDPEVFREEIAFLTLIGQKISESKVLDISKNWFENYAQA